MYWAMAQVSDAGNQLIGRIELFKAVPWGAMKYRAQPRWDSEAFIRSNTTTFWLQLYFLFSFRCCRLLPKRRQTVIYDSCGLEPIFALPKEECWGISLAGLTRFTRIPRQTRLTRITRLSRPTWLTCPTWLIWLTRVIWLTRLIKLTWLTWPTKLGQLC